MRKRIYLFSLVLIACCVSSCGTSYNLSTSSSRRVITGLENFLENYAYKYKGKRAAVATNPSGVNFDLENNIKLLREKNIEIALILAPEHGLYGYQNEYDEENYVIDDSSNAIVYNLYYLNSKTLRHLLKTADILIFDMQGMGMRCYTYISSLKFIIDSLPGTKIELIVLDRPNPLGFLSVNGPYLDNKFYSKDISSFPAPLFYGMTVGEAALYYSGEYQKNIKLNVIPMEGYWRNMLYTDTLLPWIPPSPNLPTYMSSIIYSGVVLLEGVNISLGRGTAKPFEYIGAPWIKPVAFCKGLRELDLKNFVFRPVYFEPSFSRYKNKKCGGVQIIYTGGEFNPVEMAYKLISYIMRNYSQFKWEMHNNTYTIDYLAGTDKFRKAVSINKNFQKFTEEIENELDSFSDKRSKYLIYNDEYFPL